MFRPNTQPSSRCLTGRPVEQPNEYLLLYVHNNYNIMYKVDVGIMSQMVLWVSTAHNGVLKTSVFRREGVIPSIFCAKSDNGRINTTLYLKWF